MLTFDSTKHEYRLDGNVIPSVTQILSPLVDLSGVPGAVLLHAGHFGTAVHLACELWDKNDLDESSVDEGIRPYLTGWQQFVKDSKCEIVANELIMANVALRYAGTIDRVLKLWGDISIVDIKTGTVSKTEGFQTAGYQYLWNSEHPEMKAVKRYTAHFDNGKVSLIPYTDNDDLRTFFAWLQVRNSCIKNGIDHYSWQQEIMI